MKECPDCNTEYSGEDKESNWEDKKWVKLTSVANEIEFNMVAGLLQIANIPVIKEVAGIDGYLEIIIGVPLAGITVKVPEERYEEALQLLNSSVDEQELAIEAESESSRDEEKGEDTEE